MNNVKPFSEKSAARGGKSDSGMLKSEVAYRTRLQEITNAIYAASDIDSILIDAPDAVSGLLGARRTTIYFMDGLRRELVSRFKSGNEISEIRVPVSKKSIAGYSAVSRKIVNVKDVYDAEEIAALDPLLEFDSSWDEKTGFVTRQVLAAPILFKSSLFGVVQIINRSRGGGFSLNDEKKISEIAEIIGIAFFKQRQMEASLKGRFDYLLRKHIITPEELDMAAVAASERRKALERFLVEDLEISRQEVLEALSRYYNVPSIQYTTNMMIPANLVQDLDTSHMEAQRWVPVGIENGEVVVAMANPDDLETINRIRPLFSGHNIRVAVAIENDILNIIRQVIAKKTESQNLEDFLGPMPDLSGDEWLKTASPGEKSSHVRRIVRSLISDARKAGATAIHIEPLPEQMKAVIRFRINNECRIYQIVSGASGDAVMDRIRIMAGLGISRRQSPCHGKIRFKQKDDQEIILGVTVIPTFEGGDDVVIRFLPSGDIPALDTSGLGPDQFKLLAESVNRSHGLVLVAGPPRSGRTTILHSIAALLNHDEKKIWTVENPVEFVNKGLRQVQAGDMEDNDYSSAVNSLLQADPDVIMIGDLPDEKTVTSAIKASNCGCLVLSSVNSSDAINGLWRLFCLKADPAELAEVLICVLSQRLVKTLCPVCKKSRHPGKDEYEKIVGLYGQDAFKTRLGIPYCKDLVFYSPDGCPECNYTGYQGRTGIHELLMITDEIRDIIYSQIPGRHLISQIHDQAAESGMETMLQSGIAKVFAGICDLQQVRKACL